MRRLSAAAPVVAAFLFVLLPGFPTEAQGLRIATYNVCAFPDAAQANFTKTFVCDGKILTLSDKAPRIAAGIRRIAPDVVVINEAWDEGFRKKLADLLLDDYHFQVYSIDAPLPKVEDSGLMLLSKLPFVPLRPECQGGSPVVLTRPPGGTSAVRAVIFDASEGDDASSSKAVAIARLKLSPTASAYVAFTHLQAAAGDDSVFQDPAPDVRRKQLATVRSLVKDCGPGAQELTTSPVFFAGDLNVSGRIFLDQGAATAQKEWRKLFKENGRIEYFARGEDSGTPDRFLSESGFHHASPRAAGLAEIDPFVTQGIAFSDSAQTVAAPCGDGPNCAGERFDYVFQGPYRPFRLQRQRVAWEANVPTDGGGRCNLSDHQPVVADYYPYFAPNQSVRTAKPLTFAAEDKMKMAGGSLPSARAMLWYRLEGAGGLYGILSSSRARFEVFAQNDLSRPLAPYPGSSGIRVGPKFDLPKPPYFIRVFLKDGQSPGSFTLQVTRVDCSTPDLSCPLAEGMTGSFSWPAAVINQITVWHDEMWFSFLTNESENGERPELGFAFAPEAGVCPDGSGCVYTLHSNTTRWKLDLLPNPGASPPAAWVREKKREGNTGMLLVASDLPGGANGALKEYLLRISRTQEVPASSSRKLTVAFRTPLSYLFVGSLNCSEEWQGFGDPVFDPSMLPAAMGNDDVFGRFVVDAEGGHENMPQTPPTVVPPGWTYWGSFYEETSSAQWPGPNPLRFLRKVRVDLVEWDPPLPDQNANDPYTPAGPGEFQALTDGVAEASPLIVWGSDDYHYELVASRVLRRPFECVVIDASSDANGDGYPDGCKVERVPLSP